MAHEKQFTAKQVALTVLEKVGEMLKKSELLKAEKLNKTTEVPNLTGRKEVFGMMTSGTGGTMGLGGGMGMGKAEPKGEIHPKEHVEGEPDAPGQRIKAQVSPQENTHEQAEGNNEPAGTTPKDGIEQNEELKGHLKLAKFIGRMEHKRVSKKVQSTAR